MTLDEIAELRRRRYNATVVSLHKVHSDLLVLRARPDSPPPPHQPGQYTTLGLGLWEPRLPGCQDEVRKPGDQARVVRRAYSLCCSVLGADGRLLDLSGADWLEFYVVLVRENEGADRSPALTPRLFMLREGDRLQVGDRIVGRYTLEGVRPEDTVLFLSTGTGEAPHNYMLWQLLKSGHRGRILACCCVRYRRDLAYLDVHERLMAAYPNYTYLPLLTREGVPAGQKRYIQDLITSGELEERLGRPLDPSSTHAFLCGNPNMIGAAVRDPATGSLQYPQPEGVIEVLERRGFRADLGHGGPGGNIHYEKYW